MKKVLYIDDDAVSLKRVAEHVGEKFPGIDITTCNSAVDALSLITPTLDLIMIDLEMPTLDGKKLLTYAIARGVDKRKIMIISGRESEYLHEIIPFGSCLCVLNKHDVRQAEVLDMILASLASK